MLLIIPLAYALEECEPVVEPSEIPCRITSTWNYTPPCSDYSMIVYNTTGQNIINYTFGDFGDSLLCNVTFNISTIGSYDYKVNNSDSGNVKVEGTRMWMMAILLLPLGLCFFFIYLSNSLEKVHNPLKWFFRMIALVFIFLVYQGAHIIVGLNPGYEDLAKMFSIPVYGWIFWTIMAYLLIYIIYNIFMSFKHNREWDWNETWMR